MSAEVRGEMAVQKHYKVYYKRANGCIGVGIEEYLQGEGEAEIVAFGSIFIDQSLSDYELITKILEEYCDMDAQIKVKLTQVLRKETLEEIRLKYPQIVFRRSRSRELENIKALCFDSLERKSTVYEIL